MTLTVLNARELTPSHWERWTYLQRNNPDLDSPYFCADYFKIIASLREDVFVAILGPKDEPTVFFPFQRRRLGFGQPVGSRLSDFHGVIALRDAAFDVPELMRASGLVSWEFHALLVSQAPFASYHAETYDSHYLDTSGGLKGYEASIHRPGSQQRQKLRSYLRKATEKFGKVELVPHVADPKVLDMLLDWKSAQYRESQTVDNFSYDWMRQLMHRIHAHQGEDFAGMLSALYFGDEIAAVHMGMRSRTVWHWWIMRHEEKFNEFRPGMLQMYLTTDQAPRYGVKRLDLGYGDEGYKPRFRSGAFPVAAGRVEMPSLAVSMRRWREGLETWVRKSRLYPVIKYPGRLIKRVEKWSRFR
jgi:CelD/BcsL family acetyltransferase involved in cellulose biosynthesis